MAKYGCNCGQGSDIARMQTATDSAAAAEFGDLAVLVIEHHVRVDIEDDDVGEICAPMDVVIDRNFEVGVQSCPSRCGCKG